MLILTRRRGQSIKIGDNITVSLLSLERSQVSIGIEAPRSVIVHREEIYNKIKGDVDGNCIDG